MSALIPHVAIVPDTQAVDAAQVSQVAAAVQKQVSRDFGPIWGISATVDAFDKLESVPVDYWPVILRDDINQPGAAGFHTDDHGQPFSLVQVDASWPLTVSHETLEMLADPFGNRTIAGSPPLQAHDKKIAHFKRVVYLVEVCDPCETQTYSINGVDVSDFITHHYYDPSGAKGAQYSFRGQIQAPHTVLDGGYVSFGNPVDNHWYQIVVDQGKAELRDLGVLNTKGKSLRETVDSMAREARKEEHYRTKPAVAAMRAAASSTSAFAQTSAARAGKLRDYIKALK